MRNWSKINFRSYQRLLKSILEHCYGNKPIIKVRFLIKDKNKTKITIFFFKWYKQYNK